MRYLVVGYGTVGRHRARVLGDRCVATVDPAAPGATCRRAEEVSRSAYDAVVLATPNQVKLEYLRRFLAAGKPVLVEKPLLFPGRLDAEALAGGARDGAILYTAYNHRFEPLVERLKRRLDDGAIGAVDRARLRYGNGTVRHWRGTWREAGTGILEDLGCHLVDLAGWLLGRDDERHLLLDLRPVESATYDYALFSTLDRRVLLEAGSVFWKNTFEIEIHGSDGSLHLDGLGKWGGATLVERQRVFPSGAPVETVETSPAGDTTWAADLAAFEAHVRGGVTTLENDWRISQVITQLAAQVAGAAPPGRASAWDATLSGG